MIQFRPASLSAAELTDYTERLSLTVAFEHPDLFDAIFGGSR